MEPERARRARGRSLAEFSPLLPAEEALLAAAREGGFAEPGKNRPCGYLALHRQAAGEPTPLARFAGSRCPVLAAARWRQLPRRAGVTDRVWFTRLVPRDVLRLGEDPDAPREVLRLPPAHNSRGWRVPRAPWREVVPLAAAIAATTARRVRPDFLRFLALGGDEEAPVHEKGVRLRGAWIDGPLDFEGCEFGRRLFLLHCRVEGIVDLRDARARTLNFSGTRVYAVRADRAEIDGGLFLNHDFHATGDVRFVGATIARNFDCTRGWFENPGGNALSCDGARIGGSMSLSGGFRARGAIRLLGAHIGRNLDCSEGEFRNPGGRALLCVSATIGGALILRGHTRFEGATSFVSTRVNSLVDELPCWPRNLSLEGFAYDNIAGRGFTDARRRIAWLERQEDDHLGHDFRPQPWEQLIGVLRAMGHFEEAKEIAIEKQRRLRAAGMIRGLPWLFHVIFGALTAYGYRPARLVKILACVWLACAIFYHYAASQGAFGPTNPLVFDNPKYEHCRPDAPPVAANGKARVGNWWWCDEAPGEYATFSPLFYSLNVILPVVNLGQSLEWGAVTPSAPPHRPDRTWFANLMIDVRHVLDPRTWEWRDGDPARWREFIGFTARIVVWLEELFGWAASLLLIAVLSGLAKKDDA